MDNGKYIWCRNCGAIHHVTSFDRSPLFILTAGELQKTLADDWRDFMAQHAGHRLEPLSATGNDYFPDGSAIDPMSVAYIEASNGNETLLLCRSRRSIEEPVRYEIVKGQRVETRLSLEVQENEIRKEMKLHFSWAPAAPLDDEKIDLFLALVREVVRELDPYSLSTTEYSYTDDNISYAQLSSSLVDTLMAKCSGHFLPTELVALRRFIDSHREGCDVMALIKRRSISVGGRAD
jgi:hypothetical protein